MDRLLRAIFRLNLEARRMVQQMADESNVDDSEAVEVVDIRPATCEALRFMPIQAVADFSHWEEDFDEAEWEDLPRCVQLCNWGVPHYIWDAAKVLLVKEGNYSEDRHEEEVFTWTYLRARDETTTPLHYAICADNNLQRHLFEADLGEGRRLFDAIQAKDLPALPGVNLFKAKKRTWLRINWRVIGRKMLGITGAETLDKFVEERQNACSVGLCEAKTVDQVNRRYKEGICLDLSVYE